MDGCLFAMEIVGNYINGPLFKQWDLFENKTKRDKSLTGSATMEVLALVLPSLQLDSVLFSSSSRSRRGKLLSPRMPLNEVWCLWKTWQTPSQYWSRRGRGAWGTSSFSSTLASRFQSFGTRVAELGSLSSGAKMAMKIFVKRVFTIFASNASFLRVIANLQN